AVADLQIESAGILHVEALEVAVIVGDRIEAALAQLRFDFLRVPGLDAPAETVEHRVARRARRATGSTGAPACAAPFCRRRRPRVLGPPKPHTPPGPQRPAPPLAVRAAGVPAPAR